MNECGVIALLKYFGAQSETFMHAFDRSRMVDSCTSAAQIITTVLLTSKVLGIYGRSWDWVTLLKEGGRVLIIQHPVSLDFGLLIVLRLE